MLGVRIVNDGVGTGADLDLVGDLQRLEVEDGNAVIASVADEALVHVGDEGDAVNARQIGNVGDLLERVGVNDHDVRAAGDEQTVRTRLVGEVVPETFASELDGVGQFVLLLGEGR